MIRCEPIFHFGLGGGLEWMPGVERAILEAIKVFNDPVVNDGNPAAAIVVRMRVFIAGRSVSGPGSVADAGSIFRYFRLQKGRKAEIDASFTLQAAQGGGFSLESNAGAVGTTVFGASQAFEQDGTHQVFSHRSNNSTQRSKPARFGRTVNLEWVRSS